MITGGATGEDESFRTCSLAERILGPSPSKWVIDTKLLRRIDGIENLAKYMDQQEQSMDLQVLRATPNELVFQPQKIVISANLLNQPGVLERAIFLANANTQQPMTSAVIADFLWSIQAEVEDPQPQFWLTRLKSLPQYCKSAERLLLHHGFCEAQNELGDSMMVDVEDGPIEWSLKPVLVEILKDIYKAASFEGRQNFLKNLMFMGEWNEDFISLLTQTNNLVAINKGFKKMSGRG